MRLLQIKMLIVNKYTYERHDNITKMFYQKISKTKQTLMEEQRNKNNMRHVENNKMQV